MGVVIEIFAKYPRGRTQKRGTDMQCDNIIHSTGAVLILCMELYFSSNSNSNTTMLYGYGVRAVGVIRRRRGALTFRQGNYVVCPNYYICFYLSYPKLSF
jgi:hypothetical protein